MKSFWDEAYTRCLDPLKSRDRKWILVVLVCAALLFQSTNMLSLAMPARTVETKAQRTSLDELFPIMLPDKDDVYQDENNRAMRALVRCMTEDNCTKNQKSVVLLSSSHFAAHLVGYVSGEHIWASSLITAMREMGYTFLFSTPQPDWGTLNALELLQQYHQFPDLVKIIIAEGKFISWCFESASCVKYSEFPLGIPAWKFIDFAFWGASEHPVGPEWTVNPYRYDHIGDKGLFYLGYSVERTCMRLPIVPLAERIDRAFIYGKNENYFQPKEFRWEGLSFDNFPVPGVGGVLNMNTLALTPPEKLPPGLKNLGFTDRDTFVNEVARSKVLIGVGSPPESPTPYEALCVGVPFVNPIKNWDKDDPDNRAKWDSQHHALRWLDPPYVYNVRAGDLDGLRVAVAQAIANPIGRYIDSNMTMDALKVRLEALIHQDWKTKGQQVLNYRIKQGNGRLFDV